MSLIGRLINRLLKTGRITLIEPGKQPQTYGRGESKPLTVRFADRKVALDILKNPRLGLGEAYMDGRVIIEDGTVLDLLEMIMGANRWEDGQRDKRLFRRGMANLKRFIRTNTRSRSKRNVAHHYDLGDELYETFLDSDRQYSCAYFTSPDNELDQAQMDKKAHIAAKLALEPGQKVLDIGSGWGGLALYLHQVARVDVLGITLSEDQLRVARKRAEEAGVADRVKFELIDYRALTGSFDRIVSVGMFEHVGAPNFETFFRAAANVSLSAGI